MINVFRISNFKSIRQIDTLELKPLTIFTGLNSSGKSNILEAILFFAEASRPSIDRIVSERTVLDVFMHGEIKQYPQKIEDFIAYKKDPNNQVKLEINLRLDQSVKEELQSIILNSPNVSEMFNILPKSVTKIKEVGYAVNFKFSEKLYIQEISLNNEPIISVYQELGNFTKIKYPKDFEQRNMIDQASKLFNDRVFRSSPKHPVLDIISEIASRILKYIEETAKKIYLISGERGKINSELHIEKRIGQPTPTWIGSTSQYLFEVLSRCQQRETKKYNKIVKWAKRFQLSDIRAGYVESDILESNFRDNKIGINLNTTLAGLGSRQMLSIITQIFYSEPGSVIMIEEPEISLHPENQVLLHELFSEAISQNKQIICSTHSPFFILALSKIIKKKLLTTKQIAVYQVEKDEKGTHVKPLKLNKHGFIAKGIPSFIKVEQDLFKEWSESLEEE